MVKHTQTIRRLMPTNCLIVFDHFVGLALKGLTEVCLMTKMELLPNRVRETTLLQMVRPKMQNHLCLK